jgi:methylmalonyl-CoA mutase
MLRLNKLQILRLKHLKSCYFSSYPKDWVENSKKELNGKSPEHLEWKTPEGIILKPLYTRSDIEDLKEEVPGSYPYTRGPYATMYTSKP